MEGGREVARKQKMYNLDVIISVGFTRSRLADNLAPYGTYLILRNPGNGIVKAKVWVE